MTQQSMEERFDEEWKERFKAAYKNGDLTTICSTCNDFCDAIDRKGVKAFISQEIERARQEVVSEIIDNELTDTVDSMFTHKEHCTCLPYFISRLKKKYNLE